jgi:hypothetical protein
MNYLIQLMQAEREFRKLTKVKLEASKDKSLSLYYQNRNLYDHLKCKREHQSYMREIEELAEDQFPLHLEITLHEILLSEPS